MAVNAYFSHVGTGNRTLQERAEYFGFDTFPLGENIAAGYNSVRAVVLAWMWYVSAIKHIDLLAHCIASHHEHVQRAFVLLLAALKDIEQT